MNEPRIRSFSTKFLVVLIFCICAASSAIALDSKGMQDYSKLLEFIRSEDQVGPLYVFDELDKFDRSVHKAFIGHLNRNPKILRKIQTEINANPLKWRIGQFKKRLLFVPEKRKEYISLYESYCRDVIDFILDETSFENPYAAIETLQREMPETRTDHGITVFLVHNIVEEWSGTYFFFGESKAPEMSVTLKSTAFSGEIGSYSSMLEIRDEGKINFIPNPYTIWQNSSEAPYNALIVPLEETFHVLLRSSTEQAIQADFAKGQGKKVEEIVSYWITVEEAIVGGLVDVFFRRIAADLFSDFDFSEIEPLIEEKSQTKTYKFLKSGIKAIEILGVESALNLYTSDPQRFRDLLIGRENQPSPGTS